MTWTLLLDKATLASGDGDPPAGRRVVLTATEISSAPELGAVGVVTLGAIVAKCHVSYVSRRARECRGFQLALRGAVVETIDVALAWDRPGNPPALLYYDGCEPVPDADRALVEARLDVVALPAKP